MAKASPQKSQAGGQFHKNINALLGSENQAKRTIGVMSLYGRLYYDWTISSDTIEWRGPIQNLLGVKGKVISGDMFLRKLTFDDFDARISAVAQCFKNRKTLELEYHLDMGGGVYCLIQETAEFLFTREGVPAKILGTVQVAPQALMIKPAERPPKDKLTGTLSGEELEKKLNAVISENRQKETYGSYIALSIDRLTNIAAHSGEKGVQKVIKFVGDTLQKHIREGDVVGRVSGNTFGLILHDCDRWGIVDASEKLLEAVQAAPPKLDGAPVELTVSSGGAVFPCETLGAADIMKEAATALVDAQNVRGISRFWAPSIMKGGPDSPPEKQGGTKGNRRVIDRTRSKTKPKPKPKG